LVFLVWDLVAQYRMAVVRAAVQLCHPAMKEIVGVVVLLCHPVAEETVGVVVSAAVVLRRRALPDQPRSRSAGSKPLLAGQAHGSQDIFWQCNVRRTDCSNRFPGRN